MKDLRSVGARLDRHFFGGYIRRYSNTQLDVCIICEPVTDLSDLGELWIYLADIGVAKEDITVELSTHAHQAHLKKERFLILRPDGEPDGWALKEADIEDGSNAYTVVSSLKEGV